MKSLLSLPNLDLNGLAQVAGEDPRLYRKRIYAHLSRYYAEAVDSVMTVLRSCDLDFPEMVHVHDIQLRRPLIERHCLPYLLTHQALFQDQPVDCRVLSACVAGHTLALTHLDYHLDGAAPSPTNDVTAVPVPAASAVSYAVRMIYAAGAIAATSSVAGRLFPELFNPVSGFVISRMHADWVSRFDLRYLEADPSVSLQEYLKGPRSRLNGSGYWELMVRAAYLAQVEGEVPPELITYARALRRLRQVVDETADIDEDLRSGLITLPTLLALNDDNDHWVRDAIRSTWRGQTHGEAKGMTSALRREILSTKSATKLESICSEIAADAITAARKIAGPTSAALEVLVWLKLAKLQIIAAELLPRDASLSLAELDPMIAGHV